MSWRIENADPLDLLSELPGGWAQTCFLRPPRDLPAPCLLAILGRVRRVLRDDGTLWLSLPGRGSPRQEIQLLEHAGWLRHDRTAPGRRDSLILGHSALTLLTKQQDFHFNLRLAPPGAAPRRAEDVCPSQRRRAISARRLERRAWCVPTGGGESLSAQLLDWCLRSSTSPLACGACGTPWRRLPGASDHGGRWRPGCSHSNGRGRCLILDPFCRGFADVGLAALQAGRSYLGVAHDRDIALRVRTRLEAIEREARR